MVEIELKNVNYQKNGVKILSDINFTIQNGEYITVVGLTGAGKSSLIALISGLYTPSSGQIFFDGVDVTNVPANLRNCGFMFESYVLFPHLTVLNNISYAQHLKNNDRDLTYSLGREILDLVQMSGRGFAFPSECSGGMKQRVALARALMALEDSGILILDEPFKALDAGLRLNLRREVRNIAKNPELGLTTIHVTNDMEEAMIADRIIILDNGKIKQIGSPEEVKYRPNDLFIADFFSTNLNYFEGTIIKIENISHKDGKLYLHEGKIRKITIKTSDGFELYAKCNPNTSQWEYQEKDKVLFLIHAQYYYARHGYRADKPNSLLGRVISTKFMGAWLRMEIELKGDSHRKVIAEVPTTQVAEHNFRVNEEITLYYPSEYVLIFPQDIEKSNIFQVTPNINN